MHFICLHGLQFPKRKLTVHIPAKEKAEWVRSATGKKRRKKKEAYFNYMGKLLKQVSWDSVFGSLERPRWMSCSWPWVYPWLHLLIQEAFLTHWVPERSDANSCYKLDLQVAIFFCLPFFLLAAALNTWALGVCFSRICWQPICKLILKRPLPPLVLQRGDLSPCLFCCFEELQIIRFSFNGPLYLEISF